MPKKPGTLFAQAATFFTGKWEKDELEMRMVPGSWVPKPRIASVIATEETFEERLARKLREEFGDTK